MAELEGRLQANAPAEGEEEAEDDVERLSDAEERELKRDLTAARKALKAMHKTFSKRLEEARAALGSEETQDLVQRVLRDELGMELDRHVAAIRQEVVRAVEKEWDKYKVTLRDIEKGQNAAKEGFEGFLKELGYVE